MIELNKLLYINRILFNKLDKKDPNSSSQCFKHSLMFWFKNIDHNQCIVVKEVIASIAVNVLSTAFNSSQDPQALISRFSATLCPPTTCWKGNLLWPNFPNKCLSKYIKHKDCLISSKKPTSKMNVRAMSTSTLSRNWRRVGQLTPKCNFARTYP